MVNTDVFVVGGGPAGLAAAIAARQRGLRAMVADCGRPPIDKACGEGLMPDAVAALRALGVDFDGVPTGVFHGIRFIGGEDCATAEFPVGSGIGIRRTLLHQRLIERAGEVGVEMRWGTRISDIREDAVLVDAELVRYRWLIGADGQNSQVRRWAGLSAASKAETRIGLRQHFRVAPWSELVEVYWGDEGQAYVTPVGAEEVGVALLMSKRPASFEAALRTFPSLVSRLRAAACSSAIKGAPTVTRRLRSVGGGRVALVGDASGSVDAITGEGLGISVQQALALAEAMTTNNLRQYEAAHRRIMVRPRLMGRAMLLLDRHSWLRRRALRACAGKPRLFERLLALHVGNLSLSGFGVAGAVELGWELLSSPESPSSDSGLATRDCLRE